MDLPLDLQRDGKPAPCSLHVSVYPLALSRVVMCARWQQAGHGVCHCKRLPHPPALTDIS